MILARNGALVPRLRVRLLETAMSMNHITNVTDAVKFVLACPHVSSTDETMQKPLFLALSDYSSNIDLCSLIINDSAIRDIDSCWRLVSPESGSSVIHHAAASGEIRLLELLRARGASLDIDFDGSAFYQAIKSGNVESVKFFIREDPNLATLYINGSGDIPPPIIEASKLMSGDNMVRCMIEHGADVNRGVNHLSPEARESYYSSIFISLDRGSISMANIHAKRGLLRTLSFQQLQRFIGCGFDINLEIGDETPLSYAASSGKIDWVEWLIDHGANVDGPISGGQSTLSSPLMEAIWGRHDAAAIVDILVDNGADVNGTRNYEVKDGLIVASSVHLAIITADMGVLRALLRRDANVNLEGDNYGIPLKKATVDGNVEVIRLLVSHGADINAVVQGIPVLHEAIFNRQLEAVSVLLDLGAHINISDHVRGTPLQLAKAMYASDLIHLLRTHGAQEACNLRGSSKFHYQSCRDISTTSLVSSRTEIEPLDSRLFKRRRSLALQTWGSYAFETHAIEPNGISCGEDFIKYVENKKHQHFDQNSDLKRHQ